MILRAAYNDGRGAEWLADRTRLPIVVLPFTVGGDDQARDLFSLFDDTVQRLLKGIAPMSAPGRSQALIPEHAVRRVVQ
jgi:hypothetical protein